MARRPVNSPGIDALDWSLIRSRFGNRPYKAYVVYDELMDELTVKYVPPETISSVFYLSDRFAVLIDPETLRVIGMTFLEFEREHLKKSFRDLSKTWKKEHFAEIFSEYQELNYQPDAGKEPGKHRQAPVNKNRILDYLTDKDVLEFA